MSSNIILNKEKEVFLLLILILAKSLFLYITFQ